MATWPFTPEGDRGPLGRTFRESLGLPVDDEPPAKAKRPAWTGPPRKNWIDKPQRAADLARLAEIKQLSKERRRKGGRRMHSKVKEPGFTKAQLAKWGVPWPPPKGWKKALERKGVVCIPEGRKRKPFLTVGMDEARGDRLVSPLSAPLGGPLGSIRLDDETMFLVHFDGACWPNPGGALGWGVTIKRGKETLAELADGRPQAPSNTNNVAEYLALTAALEWLLERGHEGERIHVKGDSRLVLRQMFPNGRGRRWRIKEGSYAEHARAALALLGRFASVTGEWVPRERNQRADALSQRGVRGVSR